MACLGYFSKDSQHVQVRRSARRAFNGHGPVLEGRAEAGAALRTDDQQARLRPEHLQRQHHFGGPLEADHVLQSHISTKSVDKKTRS